MSLENKAAIVTGGDSGIGHAISLELGKQGAAVTVNYHKNQEAAEATVKAIEAAGGKAQAVMGDVSSVADLQALVDKTVAAFGRLDIMVNNAGMETRTGVLDTTERQFDLVIGDRPQERVLRCPAGGEADDQAGRRRPDHQHLVDPRGLADARQRAVLRGERRRADADPDSGRGARSARHHGRRCRARCGPYADRRGHPGRPVARAKLEGAIPIGRVAEPGEIANLVAFLGLGEARRTGPPRRTPWTAG